MYRVTNNWQAIRIYVRTCIVAEIKVISLDDDFDFVSPAKQTNAVRKAISEVYKQTSTLRATILRPARALLDDLSMTHKEQVNAYCDKFGVSLQGGVVAIVTVEQTIEIIEKTLQSIEPPCLAGEWYTIASEVTHNGTLHHIT